MRKKIEKKIETNYKKVEKMVLKGSISGWKCLEK